MNQRVAWRVVGSISGLVAGSLTRKILTAAWERTHDDPPPVNPMASHTNWTQALIWAIATGVSLAVSRLVAEAGAAKLWKMATGSYPEDLEAVAP